MQRMMEQADLDKIKIGANPTASKRNEHLVKVISPEGETFEVTRRNATDLVQNMGFTYPNTKTEEESAAHAPRKRRPRGEKLAASRKADEERAAARKQEKKPKAVKNSKAENPKEKEAPVKEEKPDLEASEHDEEEVVAHDLQAQFDELEAEEAAREQKYSGNDE